MVCKKGHSSLPNQDNAFLLVDGDLKVLCVGDGHGVNGDKVSSFAISMLINYIRNVKSSFFTLSNIGSQPRAQIELEIKRAFKYVQRRIKQQHFKFKKMQRKARLNQNDENQD